MTDPRDLDDEISEADRQWKLDHPGGVISPEELAAMDAYGVESCREEGCR
jgi:hypothetical protein